MWKSLHANSGYYNWPIRHFWISFRESTILCSEFEPLELIHDKYRSGISKNFVLALKSYYVFFDVLIALVLVYLLSLSLFYSTSPPRIMITSVWRNLCIHLLYKAWFIGVHHKSVRHGDPGFSVSALLVTRVIWNEWNVAGITYERELHRQIWARHFDLAIFQIRKSSTYDTLLR